MQVWNVQRAAGWKYSTQKNRQKSPSGHHPTTLSGYIFATKACIDNRKKKLLSSNISSTCSHNMVNFVLLAAEICWRVWGTPANFNGLARHSSSGRQPNSALNRGRHLYSTGRPSRWALAHISSWHMLCAIVCTNTYYLLRQTAANTVILNRKFRKNT